jgi:hypothetical protein
MLMGAIEETEIASARAVFETNFFGVARAPYGIQLALAFPRPRDR